MKFSKIFGAVSILAGTAFARDAEQNNSMVFNISNSSAITIDCYQESVTFDNPVDAIIRESALTEEQTENFPKDTFLTQDESESSKEVPDESLDQLTQNFPKDDFLTERGSKLNKEKPQNVPHESLEQLILNDTPLTDEIIHFISQNIGASWKLACGELGYSNNQVYQMFDKYREGGIAEVVYQILLDWFQNNPEDAKLGNVTVALWHAGETELVCSMIDEYNR